MILHKLTIATTIATTATAMAAQGSSTTAIDCPAQLAADAVKVVRPAPNWTGFVPSFFVLDSVGVTVGALQERATLRGDYQELPHKAYQVSFPLDDAKGEKWLMCEYARGLIVQAQRLPASTTRCDVLYTPDKHGILSIKTTCQMPRNR